MIRHYCDRCGNEIPKDDQRTYVQPRDQDMDVPIGMRQEYELCLNCKHDLKDFLAGVALVTR